MIRRQRSRDKKLTLTMEGTNMTTQQFADDIGIENSEAEFLLNLIEDSIKEDSRWTVEYPGLHYCEHDTYNQALSQLIRLTGFSEEKAKLQGWRIIPTDAQ